MTSDPLCATRLRTTLAAAEPALRRISDADSAKPRAVGKWSPREIIGHLIDSASNNHQRFVRATWMNNLVFVGYQQNEWVELQKWGEIDWNELLTFWVSYNRHIARVMCAVPADVRLRAHTEHNLDKIADWSPKLGTPANLDYFMRDYVDHLEKHLRQILGENWNPA
jgi:hypothetical protein